MILFMIICRADSLGWELAIWVSVVFQYRFFPTKLGKTFTESLSAVIFAQFVLAEIVGFVLTRLKFPWIDYVLGLMMAGIILTPCFYDKIADERKRKLLNVALIIAVIIVTAPSNLSVAYDHCGLVLETEHPNDALVCYRAALLLDAKNEIARYNLNRVVWGINKNATDWKDREKLGDDCAAAKDYDGARVEYKEALRLQNAPSLEKKLAALPAPNSWNQVAAYPVLYVFSFATSVENIDGWSKCIQAYPNYSFGYAQRGHLYIDYGQQYLKAMADLNKALEINPNHPYAYANRALINLAAGQNAKVVADCTKSIAINPTDWKVHASRAEAYRNLKEYNKATEDYKQILKIDPNVITAYLDLAVNYCWGTKEYQKAIDACNEALKRYPGYADAYYYRGSAYLLLKDYHNAIDDFDHAIQLNPNDPKFYIARSWAYFQGPQQYKEALADCDKALAINPKLTDAYTYRDAVYFWAFKQYQKVIDDANHVMTIDPKNADAYDWRGCAYCELGQYQKAIDDCNKAIQLNPQMAEAYSDRGHTYSKSGQPQKGIADCDKALAIEPQSAHPYMYRGEAHLKLGQYQQAVSDCTKAIELEPTCIPSYSYRADAYAKLGKSELAQKDRDYVAQNTVDTTDK